jgi:single-stranded DNA-binding protein
MLEVLMSGKLLRDPVTRTGASGKPFTTALLRVPTEKDESLVASVIAFGDTAERLGRLRAGDAVSVSGSAKLSEWTKDGETHHGLSVTAATILTAYDARKRRGDTDTAGQGAARPTGRESAGGNDAKTGRADRHEDQGGAGNGLPFDDELTF